MDSLKLLDKAYRIREIIEENMQKLRELEAGKAELPHTTIGSGGGSGENKAAYTKAIEAIERYERIILQDNARLAECLSKIELIINKLDRWDYRLILKKKYINDKSLNDIAEEMNRSEKTIQRKHKEALEAFDKAYKTMPKKFF